LKTREADVLQSLSVEEIINAMHQLSYVYRTIFNMFVVEGYPHKEIAKIKSPHLELMVTIK